MVLRNKPSYKNKNKIWKYAQFVVYFAKIIGKTPLKVKDMEGKNLLIVESPGKVGTIQKYLGSEFTVKASKGHIRDLQEHKLSVDISNGFKPEYVIPADKKRLVAELKKMADAADTIWLASDEDREGEAISWHLQETLKLDPAKTKRIVFHEITKTAILEAIKAPRCIDMNLVNAQQARRVMDRLVGFELSPILWKKIQPKLSAGRVQSVALRIVVDREKEIMDFQSEPYYKVEGTFRPEGLRTQVKATLEGRVDSIEEAMSFLQDSVGATYKIQSVEKKEGKRFPAPPFTTSTLQQEAARKLRFPVATTMRIAQALYERGLITYMRTDSTNLSGLAINSAKQFIVDNYGENYSNPRQYHTKSKGAQEAHEAIRPTYISNTGIIGTAQEQKLYQLIWKRTVASQMSDAQVMNTAIRIASSERPELFVTQASELLFDGFMKVYLEGKDDDNANDETGVILPEMRTGMAMEDISLSALCNYTSAPPRYSEASLVKKLEELGIGRPSTYGPTISTLTTGRGYIVRGDKDGTQHEVTNLTLKGGRISSTKKKIVVGAEKGKLLPQEIGLIVSDYLVKNFGDVVDYDFTANVEKDFDRVAEGEMAWVDAINIFYNPFHTRVEAVLKDGEYSRISREIGIAPDGDRLIAAFGKFGAYVQKGEGENRQFAALQKGQLIESITVADALKLFELPRLVGQYQGIDIVATKGRFGPYLKYGDKNVKMPRGTDPLKISLEECIELVNAPAAEKTAIQEWNGIQVLVGSYGPYIKSGGKNYKIPRGVKAEKLTEAEARAIIEGTFKKKK